MTSIEVGHNAPNFVLPSTTGEVNLQELLKHKRAVLAFYNEDGTPT